MAKPKIYTKRSEVIADLDYIYEETVKTLKRKPKRREEAELHYNKAKDSKDEDEKIFHIRLLMSLSKRFKHQQ